MLYFAVSTNSFKKSYSLREQPDEMKENNSKMIAAAAAVPAVSAGCHLRL